MKWNLLVLLLGFSFVGVVVVGCPAMRDVVLYWNAEPVKKLPAPGHQGQRLVQAANELAPAVFVGLLLVGGSLLALVANQKRS